MVSCSASMAWSSSVLTPTALSAGQAISCSPSWWWVSWSSKFAHALASWAALVRSPGWNVPSAVMNRSRSRRKAPWMALFMLISPMAGG